MPRVHFLNVNDGDCSIIQHGSGRVTVIDVSAAKNPAAKAPKALIASAARFSYLEAMIESFRQKSKAAGVYGNFNQSENPDDPIRYLLDRGINSVFRFISTHPDMDHLDGIKPFFEQFKPMNFWDTNNTKEMEEFDEGRFDPDDWQFYVSLRDGKRQTSPKRLALYSGNCGQFWNRGEYGQCGGDGLNILAPTRELVESANAAGDWNDSSYVILYRVGKNRILFPGDSHDKTWKHILANHGDMVKKVDVLIAPHHGRDSGRNYEFLDSVNPKLTLFGNAPSEHLAYDAWNNRDLLFITNNQGGTIILNVVGNALDVYVSHEPFARAFVESRPYETHYNADVCGWFIGRFS